MAKPASNLHIALRVVVYHENGTWLAHCLEMDIVAEGENPQEAMKDLVDLCNLQVRVALEEGDLESVVRPAPPGIWKMFFMGEEMPGFRRPAKPPAQPSSKRPARKPTRKPVERFEAREFELV
jgi:hypothetical protein